MGFQRENGSGEWVVDQTKTLSSNTILNLNEQLGKIDQENRPQIGVLIVGSTNGLAPRQFATDIFNQWGIGSSTKNDGILLFIAVNDRKSEIILGKQSKLDTSETDRVMSVDVVANMKRGNLEAAVTSAIDSLDALQRSTTPSEGSGIRGFMTPVTEDNTSETTGNQELVIAVDHLLAPYAEGQTSFVDRAPRSFVVDVSNKLTKPQREQLDFVSTQFYEQRQGRLYFLIVNSTARYPGLEALTARFVRQVQPLSSLPLGVIALDLGPGNETLISLNGGPELTELGMDQTMRVQQEMSRSVESNLVGALTDGARYTTRLLTRGVEPKPMHEVLKKGVKTHAVLLGATGSAGFLGLLSMLKRWNRRRQRDCGVCQNARQLLSDSDEDKHLSPGQLKEESVKSVDYDVWWCGRCDDVLVLDYSAFFSGHSKCQKCSVKTLKTDSTTLSRATEYSSGTKRIDERCLHCNHSNSYKRTIPRIVRSSSSDSSSSSSGSSFGGGSSSGRGSTGSW